MSSLRVWGFAARCRRDKGKRWLTLLCLESRAMVGGLGIRSSSVFMALLVECFDTRVKGVEEESHGNQDQT